MTYSIHIIITSGPSGEQFIGSLSMSIISVGFKGAINLNYIMSFMCYIVYLVYFQYSGVYFPKPVPSLSWLPLIVFRFALPICFSRFALFDSLGYTSIYLHYADVGVIVYAECRERKFDA